MLSAVSHTVVRRPSGATAGLITVEFNYELSYITTESLISIHPLAPLTRWHHAVCAQSAYRVHTAIVLSENERSRCTLDLYIAKTARAGGGGGGARAAAAAARALGGAGRRAAGRRRAT